MFENFRENVEAADINQRGKPEISQEAQEKFERLFKSDDVFVPDYEPMDNDYEIDVAENLEQKQDSLYEPNTTYEIGENTYETDDRGNVYKKDGEILANTQYIVNGSVYRTDECGNKVSCDAHPRICEEGRRNITEQRESGGEDRRACDQGGHIIARILGGAEGEENLVPMRGTINQGDYKKMELEMKKALEENKNVDVHIELKYEQNSSRPTKMMATYLIDDRKTETVFDNEENSTELLDFLEEKITHTDYMQLKEEIDDMKNDGYLVSITSVKTELDENGNAVKVTAGILDESAGIKSYKVFEAR